MPSLRRSLIGYFLVLLLLALGGVGLLIDRFANDALRAREEAEHRRIDKEYESRCAESQNKFDEELLTQAHALGLTIREKYSFLARVEADNAMKRFNIRKTALALGDLGNPLQTVIAASMTTNIRNNPARDALFWSVYTSPETDESITKSFAESGDHPEIYQIDIPRFRRTITSPDQKFEFPKPKTDTELVTEANPQRFDDVTMAKVGELRRVIFRTDIQYPRNNFFTPNPNPNPPGVRTRGNPPQGGGGAGFRPGGEPRGNPTPGPVGPPAPGTGGDAYFPTVYVQVARKKGELNELLAVHTVNRDTQLTRVTGESVESRNKLRKQMGMIALFTFLAFAIGGWILVTLGLNPLRKLTHAVSRVNEKDFHLDIEKKDLTAELAPIHDRLTQSLDALKRAFSREKDAVADISHELRTPVAGLLATLDVSLRKPRTAEQYKGTLEECRAITKQLSHLVERVMTLAYLDAGQTTTTIASTDAAELAEGCAAVLRPLAESHGLTLNAQLGDPIEVTTDADKLREVVMNLLHNAVEYSLPGGEVRLSVQRAEKGVLFEVSDTGIGMTPEVQGKIFERFYRADPSRTTTGVHAGLGLAIVKEYVQRLGGTIAVESQVGRGSTFRVTLPLAA